MPLIKTKKAVAIGLSLSMMANFSSQVYASDLVAFPQNNSSIIIPPNSSIVQSNSTNFSMKSIESKISNILNPAKKEGGNRVNRKQLATDASGSCGTGVTYTFTGSDGKLTISGSGAMTNYSTNTGAPWYSYKSYIKQITIENGVTSIGSYSFFDFDDPIEVKICDGVKTISSYAFYYSDGITSLTIPDSVTSIGNHAFDDCDSLTSVTIPSSVTSIGNYAFSYCSLTSVTIPSSVTSIGYYAFYKCSNLTSVTIENGVTSIGEYAFQYCYKLTSVTYKGTSNPSAYSNIFASCSQLKAVNVPSDYIGNTFCGKPIKKPATNNFTPFIQSVYNRVLYFIKLVNCYILIM